MDDTTADADLVAASVEQPHQFGYVFERHWEAVFRFFERRLGPEPAADLASEVFRIAFERRSAYEPDSRGTCLPWLYGIAANLALKERRRFARHQAASDRLRWEQPHHVGDHAAAVAGSVDREAVWPRLREALLEIDDVSREMLLLVSWEDLSYRQVAEAFETPLGTVRSRLHRARARLRARLDRKEATPDRAKE